EIGDGAAGIDLSSLGINFGGEPGSGTVSSHDSGEAEEVPEVDSPLDGEWFEGCERSRRCPAPLKEGGRQSSVPVSVVGLVGVGRRRAEVFVREQARTAVGLHHLALAGLLRAKEGVVDALEKGLGLLATARLPLQLADAAGEADVTDRRNRFRG